MVYQDISFFFLSCIYDNVICKMEVGNKPTSDAETTFIVIQCLTYDSGPGSLVVCASAWYGDGRGFDHWIRQHSFVEMGHEIISTAILIQPLIHDQVGQLSDVHLVLVNRLGNLPMNRMVK